MVNNIIITISGILLLGAHKLEATQVLEAIIESI